MGLTPRPAVAAAAAPAGAAAGAEPGAAGPASPPPPLPSAAPQAFRVRTVGPGRRPQWVLGEIVDKEYCQAKKTANRFKVPIGTKFYRVKAVPWTCVIEGDNSSNAS